MGSVGASGGRLLHPRNLSGRHVCRMEHVMKLPRRTFLRLAAGAAALPMMPRITTAQPMQAPTRDASAGKTPVLGYMANENVNPDRLAIFEKGLVDLGYVEGKTI